MIVSDGLAIIDQQENLGSTGKYETLEYGLDLGPNAWVSPKVTMCNVNGHEGVLKT